jgi:hypothetical protein
MGSLNPSRPNRESRSGRPTPACWALETAQVSGCGFDTAEKPRRPLRRRPAPSPSITNRLPATPPLGPLFRSGPPQELVREMVEEDLVLARRDQHSVGGGFQSYTSTSL